MLKTQGSICTLECRQYSARSDRMCFISDWSDTLDTKSLLEKNENAVNRAVPERSAHNAMDGMRAEFKEAMDSYEVFYEEYCAFLAEYEKNPTDLLLLAQYADMVSKLAETDQKFAIWENKNMTHTELTYYSALSNRITQKLLEIV